MKGFLKKLKILDHLTVELEISKGEFIKKLQEHVDERSIGFFSDAFDIFSSSKNEYKGHVGLDRFEIKKRRRLFERSNTLAIAVGTYRQKDEVLIVDMEINGFRGFMIPLYVFLIAFYLFFLIGYFFISDGNGGSEKILVLPIIFLHGLLMLGIPYFIMRSSTTKMKRELEREFYFLAKKDRKSY